MPSKFNVEINDAFAYRFDAPESSPYNLVIRSVKREVVSVIMYNTIDTVV